MGLPPPLGASSRRVRCRLSVRSQAIHPAAGCLLRRGLLTRRRLFISPQALLRRRLFISPRAINSPQAIHFAAGAISPRAIHFAAGYSFRRRRSRLKLHHRRHLSRDRDERAAAGKHPTVFNQVAVLGEFGREFKQGVSIIGQCRKIVL